MTTQLHDDLVAPTAPRRRLDAPTIESHTAVWILAGSAALVAGILNTSAPIGIGLADALYRAAFAGTAVWFASRSRRWTWPILSGIAAISTASLVGQICAVVALGAAAGALGASKRRRTLGAAIAAASLPALLAQGVGPLWRLTGGAIEDPFGTSAIITAVAVAPVFVSGSNRLPRRTRRRLHRAVRISAAAVVVTVAASAAAVLGSVSTTSDAARATVQAAELGGEGDMQGAADRFAEAADLWAEANGVIAGPWMLPGRLLPVIGPHVRAAQVTTGQASALTRSAAVVADRVDTEDLIVSGRVNIEELDELSPAVTALAETARGAEERLTDANSPWLAPQLGGRLTRGLDRLGPLVGVIGAVSEALPVTVDLLGGDEPSTLLVMFTTPAEARGSGGFVGSWAEFAAEDGHIDFTAHRRSKELNDRLAEENAELRADPDYVNRYGRFAIERHIQDVTISPDFPAVAAVAADLYGQATGAGPDAVMMLDPLVLDALLEFTGPISGPDGTQLVAGSAADLLLRGQYELFEADEDGRELLLDGVAATVVERLLVETPDPIAMAKALAPLAEQGRLALWLAEDRDGAIVDRLGLDAAFPNPGGDLLAIVHQNGGQNKIDTFLRRDIDVNTTLDVANEEVRHDVRLSLRNDATSDGLPDSIIGSNDQGLPPGTNRLTLSVYSPLGALEATIDGSAAALEPQTEFGLGVYSLAVVVPPESTVIVELALEGPMAVDGDYGMHFDAQPLANPDALTWRVARRDREPIPAPAGWRRDGPAVVFDTLLDKPRALTVEID